MPIRLPLFPPLCINSFVEGPVPALCLLSYSTHPRSVAPSRLKWLGSVSTSPPFSLFTNLGAFLTVLFLKTLPLSSPTPFLFSFFYSLSPMLFVHLFSAKAPLPAFPLTGFHHVNHPIGFFSGLPPSFPDLHPQTDLTSSHYLLPFHPDIACFLHAVLPSQFFPPPFVTPILDTPSFSSGVPFFKHPASIS